MSATRWLESRAPRGMVASPHVLASQSGVAAMHAGGHSPDAAIPPPAPHPRVYPPPYPPRAPRRPCPPLPALGGAGAGARAPSTGGSAARGFCDSFPAGGGPAALTVPGVVDGWWRAHEYSSRSMGSTLTWKTLLADAIAYAR